MNEDSIYGLVPIIKYIDWGLRVRGVFDNLHDTKTPSADLLKAYELGLFDGRISAHDCSKNGILDLFLMKKYTLLFLCEYGDEIIYSRYG